jgi:hypothetical protein
MKTLEMPVVTISTASGDVEVKYTANMRFADFSRHNAYADFDIANEHYKAAKAVFAQAVEAELSKLKAVDAKQSAVAKGNSFIIRTTITKEQNADCTSAQHVALVQQWAHKKAVDSQKAQEKASQFMAELKAMKKVA